MRYGGLRLNFLAREVASGTAAFQQRCRFTAGLLTMMKVASGGRQRRSPATVASDGRQRRSPATVASEGRQRRSPATIAGARRSSEWPALNSDPKKLCLTIYIKGTRMAFR